MSWIVGHLKEQTVSKFDASSSKQSKSTLGICIVYIHSLHHVVPRAANKGLTDMQVYIRALLFFLFFWQLVHHLVVFVPPTLHWEKEGLSQSNKP